MLNTTTKTIALAIISGGLLAATMSTPTFARDSDAPRVQSCHTANCKHVKGNKKIKKNKKVKKNKKKRSNRGAWASSHDPATGRRITSIGNGDGTRTVIGVGVGFGPIGIQIWQSN